jgi:FlaG/FlaF family flagellin (archaellin)
MSVLADPRRARRGAVTTVIGVIMLVAATVVEAGLFVLAGAAALVFGWAQMMRSITDEHPVQAILRKAYQRGHGL